MDKTYFFHFTAKDDHTAAFMWDGINYLLKMPSDLDYLDKYLAIKKWLGFSIVRNPFCVPFGMDGGKRMHTGDNNFSIFDNKRNYIIFYL